MVGGAAGERIGGVRGERIGGVAGERIGGVRGERIGGVAGERIGGVAANSLKECPIHVPHSSPLRYSKRPHQPSTGALNVVMIQCVEVHLTGCEGQAHISICHSDTAGSGTTMTFVSFHYHLYNTGSSS